MGGVPEKLKLDNDPELIFVVLIGWTEQDKIQLKYSTRQAYLTLFYRRFGQHHLYRNFLISICYLF